MTFLLHFIFIAAFLLIYIIAIIVLKPARIHRKRPVSTISIKVILPDLPGLLPLNGLSDSVFPSLGRTGRRDG